MLQETRLLFDRYLARTSELNNGANVSTKFAVAPTVEQRLEEVMRQGSEFLLAVNITPVTQQSGQKLGIGTTRPLAGRTDTSGAGRRVATDPTDETNRGIYFCYQTNSDHALKYAKLDSWRHKPEFPTLIRNSILAQQGRDRIMVGWNGTSAAATTDRVANPLLQDVNIGWLQKLRTQAPAQVIADGDLTVYANGANNPNLKKIYVKAGVTLFDASLDNKTTAAADYSSLDALALDAKRGIAEWHRTSTDLVVIVGMDLVDEKYFNIAQTTGTDATEVEATDRILRSAKQIGGLPAVMVPFFPANALCITSLNNLSIYVQEGTRRRHIKDEPEADQVANYESVNEAYVVEDVEKMVLVENIVMGAAPARPAAP